MLRWAICSLSCSTKLRLALLNLILLVHSGWCTISKNQHLDIPGWDTSENLPLSKGPVCFSQWSYLWENPFCLSNAARQSFLCRIWWHCRRCSSLRGLQYPWPPKIAPQCVLPGLVNGCGMATPLRTDPDLLSARHQKRVHRISRLLFVDRYGHRSNRLGELNYLVEISRSVVVWTIISATLLFHW